MFSGLGPGAGTFTGGGGSSRAAWNSPSGLPTSAMQTAVRWNPRWALPCPVRRKRDGNASMPIPRMPLCAAGGSGGLGGPVGILSGLDRRSALCIHPQGARGCLLDTGPFTLGSRLLRLRRGGGRFGVVGKPCLSEGRRAEKPHSPVPGAPQAAPVTDLFARQIAPARLRGRRLGKSACPGRCADLHRGALPAVRHLEPVQLCLGELFSFPSRKPSRKRSRGAPAMTRRHPGWKPAPCACRLGSTGWLKRFQCLGMRNQRLCTSNAQVASALRRRPIPQSPLYNLLRSGRGTLARMGGQIFTRHLKHRAKCGVSSRFPAPSRDSSPFGAFCQRHPAMVSRQKPFKSVSELPILANWNGMQGEGLCRLRRMQPGPILGDKDSRGVSGFAGPAQKRLPKPRC